MRWFGRLERHPVSIPMSDTGQGANSEGAKIRAIPVARISEAKHAASPKFRLKGGLCLCSGRRSEGRRPSVIENVPQFSGCPYLQPCPSTRGIPKEGDHRMRGFQRPVTHGAVLVAAMLGSSTVLLGVALASSPLNIRWLATAIPVDRADPKKPGGY
jgi:hypothetical protein